MVKTRPQLKPHEERLLHVFGVFPRLTIRQAATLPLYSTASVKHVSTVLKVLETNGYLLHGYKEGTASPVHHFVYAPDTLGREFLREEGYALPGNWRRSEQTKFGFAFMEHTLEISDILIAAVNAGVYDPRIRTGAVIHDEFMGARVSGKLPVKPDAFVPMTAIGNDVSFAVELDRSGKEDEAVWKRKIQGYFRNGVQDYLGLFETQYLTVAVVVNPIRRETRMSSRLTPEELETADRTRAWERLLQLSRWTAEAVRRMGLKEDAAQCFNFTIERAANTPPREALRFFTDRNWYCPYEPEARSFVVL